MDLKQADNVTQQLFLKHFSYQLHRVFRKELLIHTMYSLYNYMLIN